ncbi:MAG: hypothetical protein LBS57_11830, partial [Treponema sp.]|nr:hypothetical protein [Treponema sp.]
WAKYPTALEGFGTPADPYLITTAAEFRAIGTETYGYDKNYILSADMTVTAPNAGPFTGAFDGGGKKVTLIIGVEGAPASGETMGLFGILNGAAVRNLVIDGLLYAAGNDTYAGAVAGQAYNSTIQAVASHAIIVTVSKGSGGAGGVAGRAFNLTVEDSYSTRNIIAIAEGGAAHAGGIIGSAGDASSGSRVTINRCFSSSKITAEGATGACSGGILSLVNTGTTGAVNNCAALNSGITTGGADPSRGRIVNIESGVTLNNNYAEIGMVFTPVYTPSNNVTGPDGAAVPIQDTQEKSWWTATLHWSFGSSSNAPWSWGAEAPTLWFE